MKKLALLLCLLTASAVAQISGAGSLGCNPNVNTGTVWNSGTAANSTQQIYSANSSTLIVVVLDTDSGTFTGGGAVTFLVSYDGTNYVTPTLVSALSGGSRSSNNPYTLLSNHSVAFAIPVYGAQYAEIKLSTAITGSGNLTPYYTTVCSPQPYSFDTYGNLYVTASTLSPGGETNIPSYSIPTDAGQNIMGLMNYFGTSPGSSIYALNVNSSLFQGTAPVSASAPLSVVEPKPSTIVAGQQAVTATAAALSTQAVNNKVCVEALSTNAISVFLGPSGVTTSTGFELVPKAVQCYEVSNVNAVYVIASTTGASVTWSGN